MGISRRRINSAIILAVLVVSGLLFSYARADDYRDPNALEWCYHDLAIKLKYPSLCEKISPNAVYSAPWSAGPSNKQIFFWRSMCFYNTAQATHDPRLCRKVKQYSAPFTLLDGSGISEEGCMNSISGSSPEGYYCDQEMLLNMLGYDRTNMPDELKEGDYPYYFMRNPEIKDKLSRLPDFSEPGVNIDAVFKEADCGFTNPYERYECYAEKLLKSNDPAICAEISRESDKIICRALYDYDPGICKQIPERFGVNIDRDNCYALVGMHNRDLGICEKIDSWVYNRDCIIGIAILERDPGLCDTWNQDVSQNEWCREYVISSMEKKQ